MLRDTWNRQEESALRQYKGPERKDVCGSKDYRKSREGNPKAQ